MGSAFKWTTDALFLFCFLTNSKTICISSPSQVYIVPEQTGTIKKKKLVKKSSKVPFKENASPVRCPVPGVFVFLANLLWRGVAVNKKRAKVKPRFRSFLGPSPLKKILKIDPRQKQLKLEETDNAIIKNILSSLWQNFLFFRPTSNGR